MLHREGNGEPARERFLEAQARLERPSFPLPFLSLSRLRQQALLAGELASAQWINRQALCLARAQGSRVCEGGGEREKAQVLE
ncbi:hypothetical protein B1218_34345, partial [Pseudomonas ogarae]